MINSSPSITSSLSLSLIITFLSWKKGVGQYLLLAKKFNKICNNIILILYIIISHIYNKQETDGVLLCHTESTND